MFDYLLNFLLSPASPPNPEATRIAAVMWASFRYSLAVRRYGMLAKMKTNEINFFTKPSLSLLKQYMISFASPEPVGFR
jgi:hypothetical protein